MGAQLCQGPWGSRDWASCPIILLKTDWFSEVMCTGVWQELGCSQSPTPCPFIHSFTNVSRTCLDSGDTAMKKIGPSVLLRPAGAGCGWHAGERQDKAGFYALEGDQRSERR